MMTSLSAARLTKYLDGNPDAVMVLSCLPPNGSMVDIKEVANDAAVPLDSIIKMRNQMRGLFGDGCHWRAAQSGKIGVAMSRDHYDVVMHHYRALTEEPVKCLDIL